MATHHPHPAFARVIVSVSVLAALAVAITSATSFAQPTAPVSAPGVEWWPGTVYDAAIPTPKSVIGHGIGEYYTEHLQMLDYMRRLEAASGRVKVFSVGRTNERRELVLVAISDPANIRNLEAIRQRVDQLRDPRKTSAAAAKSIAEATPAIAWMSFANDGNESAAFETGIQLAYHLASGQDPTTERILKELVTVIYPAHNPESHSRHVAWMKASATGNPDPSAQEHRGDWRMDTNNNHYQIDLNRDAAFLTQVESQVIVEQFHRWNPVVFIDHHGNPDRFFFPPWARPVNPQVDPASKTWVEMYGKRIADAFDRGGWTYFTRQVFDLHYPGYYDSYPTLNGATGMTFETDGGGNKGLAYRLPDGRVTTLLDGILHHFTGAMATLVATAEQRAARLMAFYEFRANAVREAETDTVRQYVIVPGRDPGRAADLVALLLKHRIEVSQTTREVKTLAAHDYVTGRAEPRTFPAGSFVVSTAQPQKRLLRTLLDPDTPMEPAFLEEVMRARAYNDTVADDAPKKPYGFYDINAWSLPLAHGVGAYWTTDRFADGLEPVASRPTKTPAPVGQVAPGASRARYAYLFSWNTVGGARLAASLWRENIQLAMATEPFAIGRRKHAPGTVVVRAWTNPEAVHDRVRALAAQHEVELVPVDTAMADEGKDLGDRTVVDLKPAKIAILTEAPTSSTAYGAIWWAFEKYYGIPFTAIRGQDVGTIDLSPYNVILMPDGSAPGYLRVLGQEGADRLKNWVREGGVLVTVKAATLWASGERVGLTTARDKFATPEGGGAGQQTAQPGASPGESRVEKDAKPPRRMEGIPGAFVKLDVDAQHFLGVGIDEPVAALFRSNVVFTPSKKGAMLGVVDKERPILSGFAFDDSREAIKGAPFMWEEPTGRGRVICFADDVAFRGFLVGAQRLLVNAVMLGPSVPVPGRF